MIIKYIHYILQLVTYDVNAIFFRELFGVTEIWRNGILIWIIIEKEQSANEQWSDMNKWDLAGIYDITNK